MGKKHFYRMIFLTGTPSPIFSKCGNPIHFTSQTFFNYGGAGLGLLPFFEIGYLPAIAQQIPELLVCIYIILGPKTAKYTSKFAIGLPLNGKLKVPGHSVPRIHLFCRPEHHTNSCDQSFFDHLSSLKGMALIVVLQCTMHADFRKFHLRLLSCEICGN